MGEQLRGEAVEIAQAAIGMAAEQQHVLVSRTVKDLVVGTGFTFERRGVIPFGKELWEFFQVGSPDNILIESGDWNTQGDR